MTSLQTKPNTIKDMKTTLQMILALCALLLASCATSTNYGGGGHSAKGGMSRGNPGQVATSSVELNMFNLHLGGAMVGRPPIGVYGGGSYGSGYGGGYRPSPCPPGYGRQQMYDPRRHQRPSFGGYGGNYVGVQRQPYGYPGHSANPIMVNGVAFSDQYPGGVRVARPR